jgi:hypothetical protein
MRVMDDLIDTAMGAELTRRKIFCATGAFHKKLPDSCRQRRPGVANGGSAKLDGGRAASVVRSECCFRSRA